MSACLSADPDAKVPSISAIIDRSSSPASGVPVMRKIRLPVAVGHYHRVRQKPRILGNRVGPCAADFQGEIAGSGLRPRKPWQRSKMRTSEKLRVLVRGHLRELSGRRISHREVAGGHSKIGGGQSDVAALALGPEARKGHQVVEAECDVGLLQQSEILGHGTAAAWA